MNDPITTSFTGEGTHPHTYTIDVNRRIDTYTFVENKTGKRTKNLKPQGQVGGSG